MIIVRTARQDDIDGVLGLAEQAYPGMTTLPPDRSVLTAKLSNSIESIAQTIDKPGNQTYFLVMEDLESGAIVGTAAIIACLGSKDEFYSYKLNKVTHSCKELDKKVTFEMLNLSNHFEGFSEVATLYLDKRYRKNGNGKLLARTRYLFMAQFRERFPERVMADLRGYFDEQGNSPFWDAVGSHFFEMGFAEADLYGAIHGNQFIADLMPKQPIYVNMLPAAAQAVIGQPNVVGKPAMQMLENEGFRWNGHVDIFDAAPSVDTKIDDIESVKHSELAEVIGISEYDGDEQAVIATSDIASFTTAISRISVEKGGVRLPRATLKGLGIELGDSIRYLINSTSKK
ncbi:arginine N-succinyltransferase [Arenicella xantha]|uniref:Arginine succinyltransferase n=1 Tax=Arenicella xantha TaxID=644221 RepID=A0A395JLE6_9GAMM|nr:arginine N-succinyltransferase [Arenicella xantha]RBP51592.1 arginine succinyltransferase [Arenicella xantha]